jgi:hypothetical protein
MKNSIKLVAGCFLAATAFVVSGSTALAGEGGAAGSVAAKLTSGNVTSVSSSIAVGKNAAATTSHTDTSNTFTSAVGGAGALTVTGANTTGAGYGVASEAVLNQIVGQANDLSSVGAIANTGAITLP